jgi:hypothetical protein
MPEVTRSIGTRGLIAVAIYALLVAVAAIAFQSTRAAASSGPHLYYMIYGVALALFTHMSYVLFALQSLLLVPWLLWGLFRPRTRKMAITGFCITWLGIGWYMHELF